MITRTMARESPSLLNNHPIIGEATEGREESMSPYSLSNEDMNQLTDDFDNQEDLTTSGRTYEELVNASQEQTRNSMMSEETEEEESERPFKTNGGRQSVGFMLGRNSISEWSTFGGGPGGRRGLLDDNHESDIPSSVHMDQLNTGRKSNLSRHSLGRNSLGLDTPNIMSVSHVNVSQRRSHVNNSRGTMRSKSNSNARLSRPSQKMSAVARGRRSNSLNLSHISSSSSSGFDGSEDMMGDSWSPIRTSLENSFAKGVANELNNSQNMALSPSANARSSIGLKRSGSLSPIRGRSSNSLSPKKLSPKKNVMAKSPTRQSSPKRSKSPIRSPIRSPLADISPKKAKSKSPMRQSSPKKSPTRSKSPVRSPIRSPLGDISPNRSPNRGRSPKRGTSPKRMSKTVTSPQRRSTTSMLSPKKKALSPNGTFSLKEAEGSRLSMPSAAAGDSESVGGSSNMSLTMESQETASSPELLTQSQTQVFSKETELPTVPVNQPPAEMVPEGASQAPSSATLTTDQVADTEMMMQSPKISTKGARSPAPTPNSRRRVIKRFRASIPTANYLIPEDLLENSLERNPIRKEDVAAAEPEINPNRTEDSGEETMACESSSEGKQMEAEEAKQASYENAFVFPSDSIPQPRRKTLLMFHDQAIANGSISHQYHLNRAGANQLSLQEVILPSIAYETSDVLKKMQAKAQRNVAEGKPDSEGKEVVKVIETCRKVVKQCTGEAMKVAGEAWREREKEREQAILERLNKEEEQKRLDELNAKNERKAARARSRKERYERQKLEKQRNHPRNKEMMQEILKLMVDIQKLEKEERLWKEALAEVKQLEEHHQPPEQMELDVIAEKGEDDQLLKAVEGAKLESSACTMVEDVTMATERINWMLKSVSLAMDESDKVRKEAYDKYQYDGHKFYGYPKVDDSKGLFMALSMESPFRS